VSGQISASSGLAIAGSIIPYGNAARDLGAWGNAFRTLYASTTLQVGSPTASTTVAGNNLSTGDGTSSTLLTGSSLILGAGTNYNRGVFWVDNGTGAYGNVYASGTLRVFGNVTSTGGVQISGSYTTTTLTSYAQGGAAGAFVLNSNSALDFASTTILLSVRNSGRAAFSIDATGYVASTGTFNSNVASTGIGDVAEQVNLVPGESIEAGDVVIADAAGLHQYRKSTGAHQKEVAGVISDTGAFIIGGRGHNRAPLALAGIVQVKVTNENGSINVGDYLVTAALPGYAMRFDATQGQTAGLIGMALESFTGTTGKIKIMVSRGLVNGVANGTPTLNVSQNAEGQLVQTGDLDLAGNSLLNVKSITSKSGKWTMSDDGLLVVREVKADKVTAKEFVVAADANQATVGTATIRAGETTARVENPAVTSQVKVFVTFRTNPKAFWWISKQDAGVFEVSLSQSGSEDVTLDYWLVGVSVAGEAPAAPAPVAETTSAPAPAPTSPAPTTDTTSAPPAASDTTVTAPAPATDTTVTPATDTAVTPTASSEPAPATEPAPAPVTDTSTSAPAPSEPAPAPTETAAPAAEAPAPATP
ncbi:MAG: hypothetical protein HYV42_01570, partial [Candidatus Magasanikbacteria bacterium]|nr:hypothetical protein [Candidatus Magasanikbacteria bacterium]